MTFKHGQFIYSASIHHRVAQLGDMAYANFVNTCLFRHITCDFGDLDEFDKQANVQAIESGTEQIMSSYISQELVSKIWVITSEDRSTTTITTPEEFQKGKL